MYNKYRFILFFLFGLLFFGSSSFFYWAFKNQRESYENVQMQELLNKKTLIQAQIDFMRSRSDDWVIEKEFYLAFLKRSIEGLDGTYKYHAALYDENMNEISERNIKNKGLWYVNIKNFMGWREQLTSNNSGQGTIDEGSRLTYPDSGILLHPRSVRDKMLYCYAWIPSLQGDPRYLIVIALYPDHLQYTNHIYVLGPVGMMIIYVILFAFVVYMLKVFKSRASSKKEVDVAYRLHDRRKTQ